MIPAGLFLCFFSLAGRQSITFYRNVMSGNAFSKATPTLGQFYQGGFLQTMSKREACLILGVRETSDLAKVQQAHRKLMFLNHPDNGGSTHLSMKINEAKEILLKGQEKQK